MLAELVVPSAIDAVLEKFEHSQVPFAELDVQEALSKARASLASPSEAENLGAWAEVAAFSLVSGRTRTSPWRTFFGPLGSATDKDGRITYFPDISRADPRVIVHWTSRAKTMKHPVLKARYADLTWDMCTAIGGTRRDPGMARLAVDAYLASLPSDVRTELQDRLKAAIRALDLASMIRDRERTERARIALLQLHREAIVAGHGQWWFVFDRLIDDKHSGLTEEERQQLILDLEALVIHYTGASNPENFDPHAVQGVARRLVAHYTRLRQSGDVRRLHETVARAFERLAGMGNALLASAALQNAVNAYRYAGLPEDSARTRILMEEKIAQCRDQMQPVGTEIEIYRDDIDKFLKTVVTGDLGSTFVRIATEFLPRRRDLENSVQKSAEEAPLQAHLTQTIMADDHVAAKIGSVADDPFGRLLQQTTMTFAFSAGWLQLALQRAIEVHGATLSISSVGLIVPASSRT
jgi:lysyl-tRNA synthetase class 1